MSKSFTVFGELVEILVDGQQSNGSVAVLTQTVPPGGGPPPHTHTKEDETFTPLEGEFEMFDGSSWTPLRQGEVYFAQRGGTHTFRNAGSIDGKLLVVCTPAGLEVYLEKIGTLSIPQDFSELEAISERYGIRFIA